MRKRILALAMTTAMVLGGTACGGSDAATESASTSQAATEKQNTGVYIFTARFILMPYCCKKIMAFHPDQQVDFPASLPVRRQVAWHLQLFLP